jgi:hypothetical protein
MSQTMRKVGSGRVYAPVLSATHAMMAFYAGWAAESGLKLTAGSTGTKNRDKALMIVAD